MMEFKWVCVRSYEVRAMAVVMWKCLQELHASSICAQESFDGLSGAPRVSKYALRQHVFNRTVHCDDILLHTGVQTCMMETRAS